MHLFVTDWSVFFLSWSNNSLFSVKADFQSFFEHIFISNGDMKQNINTRTYRAIICMEDGAVTKHFLPPHLLKEIEWSAQRRRWQVTHTHTYDPRCGRHRVRVPSVWTRVHITLSQVRFHTLSPSCSTPQPSNGRTLGQSRGWGGEEIQLFSASQNFGFVSASRQNLQRKVTTSLRNHIFISIPLHHQWSSGRSICWLFLLVGKWWLNQAITLETKWFSANLLANHEQR